MIIKLYIISNTCTIVQINFDLTIFTYEMQQLTRVGVKYLVYGNVKVLVIVLVLDQKVLGTWQVIFKYYLLKSVKVANYLNT